MKREEFDVVLRGLWNWRLFFHSSQNHIQLAASLDR